MGYTWPVPAGNDEALGFVVINRRESHPDPIRITESLIKDLEKEQYVSRDRHREILSRDDIARAVFAVLGGHC